MEMKLRQRIIGAVVVAALAIIFIPLLFKSSATSTPNQPTTIKIAAEIPPEPAKPVTPQTIVMNQDKNLNAASSDNVTPTAIHNVERDALKTAAPAVAVTAAAAQKVAISTTQAVQPSDDVVVDEPTTTTSTTPTTSSSAAKTTKHTTQTPKHTPIKSTTHHTTTKVAATSSSFSKHSTGKKAKTTTVASASKTPVALSGVAWAVQLGSFANLTNAKQLETELRSHGFKAYTQNIKTSMGTLVRVAIGPETKREKADAIKDRLAKEMQIKSVVVAYNPTAET